MPSHKQTCNMPAKRGGFKERLLTGGFIASCGDDLKSFAEYKDASRWATEQNDKVRIKLGIRPGGKIPSDDRWAVVPATINISVPLKEVDPEKYCAVKRAKSRKFLGHKSKQEKINRSFRDG